MGIQELLLLGVFLVVAVTCVALPISILVWLLNKL